MGLDECIGCGAPLVSGLEVATKLCGWCYADQCIAAQDDYDERDADDDVQQQELDERD